MAVPLLVFIVILMLAVPLLQPLISLFLDPFHGVAGSGFAELPSGVIRAPGVPGEATVYWDSDGVPHIFASTDEASVYALGYIMASTRLFQADLLRRLPQGKLSELVGGAAFESDRLMRTLNLDDAIGESWRLVAESGDPELSRLANLIKYFVRGFNDYIMGLKDRDLPPEYRLLGLKPEPWKPEDVVAIQKLFTMMLAWDTDDLVVNELVRKWGLNVLVDLDIVNRSLTTPQAYCAETVKWGEVTGLTRTAQILESPTIIGGASNGVNSSKTLNFLWRAGEPLRLFSGLKASNNWIVGGAYTVSGKPIVANDPHLALTAPSLWVLVHIETPNVKVAGVTIAGAPVVVIGRNERIAWGFTNVMGDFTDFYYYKWDGTRYYYKGEWLEAKVRVEIIKVWDPQARRIESRELRVLETVHGPVIEEEGERYAVAFTGAAPSLELAFIWELNRARSVVDALKAQKYFTAPIQNFVVADADGNIAYSPVGAYPLRVNTPVFNIEGFKVENRGFLPYNGSRGEGEWAGLINYGALPIIFNPPRPFIVTANSKPFDGECGKFIGWNWADRFRQDRILELLGEKLKAKGKLSLEDVMSVQTDTGKDLSLDTYTIILLKLARGAGGELGEIVKALEEWISRGAPTSPDNWEPSIALAWTWKFRASLWAKIYGSERNIGFFRLELAEKLLKDYLAGSAKAEKYIARGEAEKLALETLREALELLKQYYGTGEYKTWKYGKLHYYSPEHPILKTFNYEKKEAGGGPYSVNPASPTTLDPKTGAPVKSGASIRLASDLSTKTLNAALPGGTHGNPHSPHYQNQYKQYWTTGQYKEIKIGEKPGDTLKTLTIKGE